MNTISTISALLLVCCCFAIATYVQASPTNHEDRKKSGRGVVWINRGADNPALWGVQCPGVGRFGLKRNGAEYCARYYECPLPYIKPSALIQCPEGEFFNRLSRACAPRESANCRWCKTEGRHADKTSKKHFIECVAGSVALRYRCKEGRYDVETKKCRETTIRKVMDVMNDAEIDQPQNIVLFMRDWKYATLEEKDEKMSVDKSIEDGFVEEGFEDEDESKKKKKKKDEKEDDPKKPEEKKPE